MNVFESFHPLIIFWYFAGILILSLVIFNPIIFIILLFGEAFYYIFLKGILKGFRYVFGCIMVIPVCMAVNMIVNHRGTTVLFELGGLPITLESAVYGLTTGVLFAGTILLFGCYTHIMTSEKVMGLFGNHLPNISLVFSMALRLVPKLRRDYRKLNESHSNKKGVLTALIGFALEDSIETGISMKYRDYGKGKRTSIYVDKLRKRDIIFLIIEIVLLIMSVYMYWSSNINIEIFPYINYYGNKIGLWAYACYLMAVFMPIVIDIKEEIRWRHIVSRI